MCYLNDFLERNDFDLKNRVPKDKYIRFLENLTKEIEVDPMKVAKCVDSHSEIVMLMIVLNNSAETGGSITVAEAASKMGVSMPAASRTLKALVQKEYVERVTNKYDRRTVHIAVTEKGRAMIDGCLERLLSVINKALAEFSENEIDTMIELHGKFINAVSGAIRPTEPPSPSDNK